MYENWMKLKELGISISEYFIAKNLKRVFIYGEGEAEQFLRKELESVSLSHGCSIEMNFSNADIVVVIDEDNYLEVESKICEHNLIEVICIGELIEKVYNNRKVIQ